MYSRMWAPSIPRSVWLISQDVWPQLFGLSLAVGTGGSALFVPPAGMSAAPYGMLLGRPVLPIEYADNLGDANDIMFVDLSQYQMISKGGIQADSSMHVRFVYGENTFRFVYRLDGQPTWNSPLTPFNGGATVSPFVSLAERA
jgi:HK97 family phage major capsid protein